MKTTVRYARATIDVIELRVAMRNGVIISPINHTRLARVRQTIAATEHVRVNGIRNGLYELPVSSASVSRDFLGRSLLTRVGAAA